MMERLGNIGTELGDCLVRQLLHTKMLSQVVAFDIVHDDVGRVAVPTYVVNRCQLWMPQLRGGLPFAGTCRRSASESDFDRGSFTATARRSRESQAFQTSPMAPVPMHSCSSK